MLDTCTREFGKYNPSTLGQTLAAGFAQDQYNFSMRFEGITATVYSVAGSAAYGHGQGLRDIVVRIKTYIDNTVK